MLTLYVSGMNCQHCKQAVTRALHELDPQAEVKVDLEKGEVVVDSAAENARIILAIENAGYQVTGHK